MSRKQLYRRVLCIVLLVTIIYTGYYAYNYVEEIIPNKIHVIENEVGRFDFELPIAAEITSMDEAVVLAGSSEVWSDTLSLERRDAFSVISDKKGQYTLAMKLFGVFPIKNIEVSVIGETEVLVCGFPIGIYLETDGILVVGTEKVTTASGIIEEPSHSVLNVGDYVLAVNDEELESKEELVGVLEASRGEEMILTIRRNEEVSKVRITPAKDADGKYKLGVWVRDDTQGIGTLTYITADGRFGALGHGVSDVDIGALMECKEGSLYESEILSIIKGEAGTPGGLSGIIHYGNNNKLGDIDVNSSAGIFGDGYDGLVDMADGEYMDIALKQDVEPGKAYVRCCVNGEVKDYEVEITKINTSSLSMNRGMEIKVTDPELLALTNGIVQGMSGSPIIQDDKLIGAVTHVLVNDPTRGYGIFIEHMLDAAE